MNKWKKFEPEIFCEVISQLNYTWVYTASGRVYLTFRNEWISPKYYSFEVCHYYNPEDIERIPLDKVLFYKNTDILCGGDKVCNLKGPIENPCARIWYKVNKKRGVRI
jgi:hypothetical protein